MVPGLIWRIVGVKGTGDLYTGGEEGAALFININAPGWIWAGNAVRFYRK